MRGRCAHAMCAHNRPAPRAQHTHTHTRARTLNTSVHRRVMSSKRCSGRVYSTLSPCRCWMRASSHTGGGAPVYPSCCVASPSSAGGGAGAAAAAAAAAADGWGAGVAPPPACCLVSPPPATTCACALGCVAAAQAPAALPCCTAGPWPASWQQQQRVRDRAHMPGQARAHRDSRACAPERGTRRAGGSLLASPAPPVWMHTAPCHVAGLPHGAMPVAVLKLPVRRTHATPPRQRLVSLAVRAGDWRMAGCLRLPRGQRN
jgi:hypothetical protein